jgi:hypothetical protein
MIIWLMRKKWFIELKAVAWSSMNDEPFVLSWRMRRGMIFAVGEEGPADGMGHAQVRWMAGGSLPMEYV